MPITAAFVAACAMLPGVSGIARIPEIEAVLMIEPPPRATRWGHAALVA